MVRKSSLLKTVHLIVGLCLWMTANVSTAFVVVVSRTARIIPRLHAFKKTKQQLLQQKLQRAKQQQKQQQEKVSKNSDQSVLSDLELKERNDRLRFAELLEQGTYYSSDSSSSEYLNPQQIQEDIEAVRAGVDRLFEGDPAPTHCFANLVDIDSEQPLGESGSQTLVPWLHTNNPSKVNDYLIILTDPRPQSAELRDTLQRLTALPPALLHRLVVINADTPAENRRYRKKSKLNPSPTLYSDTPAKDCMCAYTALGQTRWSQSLFVLQNARVQKVVRELDPYGAATAIRNAVQSLEQDRRL